MADDTTSAVRETDRDRLIRELRGVIKRVAERHDWQGNSWIVVMAREVYDYLAVASTLGLTLPATSTSAVDAGAELRGLHTEAQNMVRAVRAAARAGLRGIAGLVKQADHLEAANVRAQAPARTAPPEAEAGAGERQRHPGESLLDYCARTAERVDTWPEWKKNALGKQPTPAPEVGEPKPQSVFEQAMNTAPAMLARMTQVQPGTDALRDSIDFGTVTINADGVPVDDETGEPLEPDDFAGIFAALLCRPGRWKLRAALDAGEEG